MTYEPQLGEQLVRSQDGTDLLVRRHGPRNRHAAIRSGEDGPWLPATYEDLLDFILGERAPAEEPREVVEPKSAVGLAVQELRRREVVEPERPLLFCCHGCGRSVSGWLAIAWNAEQGRWRHVGCGGECTPAVGREVVEPAPATAQRWRCEGCGWVGGDAWDHQGAMVHGYGGEDICGPCRSVVPVGEVGS